MDKIPFAAKQNKEDTASDFFSDKNLDHNSEWNQKNNSPITNLNFNNTSKLNIKDISNIKKDASDNYSPLDMIDNDKSASFLNLENLADKKGNNDANDKGIYKKNENNNKSQDNSSDIDNLGTNAENDNGDNGRSTNFGDYFIFPLLGISCFISMNSIISSQDSFSYFQSKYSPNSYFNNLFFFGNTVIQSILSCIKINISAWMLIKSTLLAQILLLLTFPLLIAFGTGLFSFIVSCLFVLLMGLISGAYLYLMNGVLAFIQFQNLVFVITGQALSSVIVSAVKMITYYAYFNNSHNTKKLINLNNYNFTTYNGTLSDHNHFLNEPSQNLGDHNPDYNNQCYRLLITFYIAALLLLINILSFVFHYKKKQDFIVCFSKLDKKLIETNSNNRITSSKVFSFNKNGTFQNDISNDPDTSKEKLFIAEQKDRQTDFGDEKEDLSPNCNGELTQFQLFKISLFQNKFYFFNSALFGFITYLFHPTNFITLKLFSTTIDLSIILTIIFFNIFESLGRLSTNFYFIKNKNNFYLVNFLRFYFVAIFVLINVIVKENLSYDWMAFLKNEVFICINFALFCYSYGFINCNSFILLGDIKDKDLQLKSNCVNSIFLGLGIFVGSTLSGVLTLAF